MKVNVDLFVETLSHVPNKLKWFLNIYPKEFYEKQNVDTYLFPFEKDGKLKTGGFVLKKDEKTKTVELITVFSVNGDFLKDSTLTPEKSNDILISLFNKAIILGANKLDCLGDKLYDVYNKKFTVVETYDFNKEYVENKNSLEEFISSNLNGYEDKLFEYKCHFLVIDYNKCNDLELSFHVNLDNKLGSFQDVNGKTILEIVKDNPEKYPKTLNKLIDFNIIEIKKNESETIIITHTSL